MITSHTLKYMYMCTAVGTCTNDKKSLHRKINNSNFNVKFLLIFMLFLSFASHFLLILFLLFIFFRFFPFSFFIFCWIFSCFLFVLILSFLSFYFCWFFLAFHFLLILYFSSHFPHFSKKRIHKIKALAWNWTMRSSLILKKLLKSTISCRKRK